MLTFTTDGMVTQHFPFPPPLMNYILENVQPQHMIKLYPTCKFFYDKYRKNIIQHLEIVPDGEDEVLDPVKTVICVSNPALSKLADFWITESFTYRASSYSLRLPELSHCIIKKLVLTKRVLWKEYEILTRAGTVEELKTLKPILIRETYGAYSPASFDTVIAQVPNAKSIEISRGLITSYASLISLNHKAKVLNIILRSMKRMIDFDLELFTEFLYKNTAENCNIHVDFDTSGLHLMAHIFSSGDVFVPATMDYTEQINGALEMKKNSDF